MNTLSSVRHRIAGLARRLDAVAAAAWEAGRSWIAPALVLAICAGAGAWALAHPHLRLSLATNELEKSIRIVAVFWILGTLAAFAALAVLVATRRRRASGRWAFGQVAGDWSRRLLPLAALPLVAVISQPGFEKDNPKRLLFCVTLAAVLAAFGAYAWPPSASTEQPRDRTDRQVVYRSAVVLALAALWIGYGLFFSSLSIGNHYALRTQAADLGYYDNIFYQSIHGRPLGCSFIKAGYHGSAHFDPLLVILSPLYLLYPRAEFLLALQSFWLGAGVVPAYLIARHWLASRRAGLLFAGAYALYPALHGANMYDFHSLTLAVPLLLWALYFLEIESARRYYPALGVALLCREDISLVMIMVGVYAIARGGQRVRMGWITIATSLCYFVIVKLFFMTSPTIFMTGKNAYSYTYIFKELMPTGAGLPELFLNLLSNPAYVLSLMFAERKVLYLFHLFLPLAFLPFFARPGRILLAFGLAFCLLASKAPVFSVGFQYAANLFPFAFAVAPAAIHRLAAAAPRAGLDGARLSRALCTACAVASLLLSWKIGGLVENTVFLGGFSRPVRELTAEHHETYAWVRAQVAELPQTASVSASKYLAPHISNRRSAYLYPRGKNVDFVFVDRQNLHKDHRQKLRDAVRQGEYLLVSERDRLALYRRWVPSDSRAPRRRD